MKKIIPAKLPAILCVLLLAGCGSSDKDSTENVLSENTAGASQQEEAQYTQEIYETLSDENRDLFNEYTTLMWTLSYYETVKQNQIIKRVTVDDPMELVYGNAEDKGYLWRKVAEDSLSSNGDEAFEYPELTEDELREQIDLLRRQNKELKSEIEELSAAVNEYEQEFGYDPENRPEAIAKTEPQQPEENTSDDKAAQETSTEKQDESSDKQPASDTENTSQAAASTDQTVEQILRSGGWMISSGSGDYVTAVRNSGENTYTIYAQDYGFMLEATNIYGEYSSLTAGCDVPKMREIAAYIVNNGISAFYYEDFGLYWTPSGG